MTEVSGRQTLFVKYASEMANLAALLDDEVRYVGRSWRLVGADRCLWNSNPRGPLTPSGALEIVEELREEVIAALPYRCAPRLARAEEALSLLQEWPFDCDATMTMTTRALDTATIGRKKEGEWMGWVAIGRDRVEVRAESHAACMNLLIVESRVRWGGLVEAVD